jgi:hypothetical protein
MGGSVTYLAELIGQPPSGLAFSSVVADVIGDDHPLRAPWARPGGVAATVAWADTALAGIGRPRTGPHAQIKSWNLSSILRLPTASGDVWCKSLPPFMVNEGTILTMISAHDAALVPRVLASDALTRTVLLDNIPGEDQWHAPESRIIEMVRLLVGLQARWAERVVELLSAGAIDWRAIALPGRFRAFLARPDVRAHLDAADLATLDGLIDDLPGRLDALAACDIPETLVHGDFMPGNWRYGADGLVLLDWGEAGVGNPIINFWLPAEPDEARARVREAWLEAWRAIHSTADPARAAELIRPIAALRAALVYQGFLDGIEPSERRYHEEDVPYWLRVTATEARIRVLLH